MAIRTMERERNRARREYEEKLAEIGSQYQAEIVKAIAPHIPEGWALTWTQSDQQYDDEDYYFGLDSMTLVTERVPRHGELLKEAVERKVETRPVPKPKNWPNDPYVENGYVRWHHGMTEEVVLQKASDAKYEWILDDGCRERSDRMVRNADPYGDVPGVYQLEDNEGMEDLKPSKKQIVELRKVLERFDDDDWRAAFGDKASVVVRRNGTWSVK